MTDTQEAACRARTRFSAGVAMAAGIENGVVLLRELRAQGYRGGYSILKDYLQPLRLGRSVKATVRFETDPADQAQVDFGHFAYAPPTGQREWYWAFVMVLSWSRLLYVEFVRRADVATFIRCQVNAFERFGGVPRAWLYDNTKVVVLGRDAGGVPHWNPTFLDFALRVGFDLRLFRPYRVQTKGPRRERYQVRSLQLLAHRGVCRSRRPQSAGRDVDRQSGERPDARHDRRASDR